MSTVANIFRPEYSHWYTSSGKPFHFIEKKNGEGMRPTTLADARKLNLLPSVTQVLKALNAPALNRWLTEQACLAVLTTPRMANEQDDAFVNRVLNVERQQDQESDKARQLGTDIHAALELALQGRQCDEDLRVYVDPVLDAVKDMGVPFKTEFVVVGDGYAGKSDLITDMNVIVDFKTTKKLPKAAYPEHRLQLSAYLAGFGRMGALSTDTFNIYISTDEPGKIAVCPSGTVLDYCNGFLPLLKLWQWLNGYVPRQEKDAR